VYNIIFTLGYELELRRSDRMPGKLHYEEFYNLYLYSSSGILDHQTKKVEMAGHVARMEKMRSAHKILVGIPEVKRQVRRSRRR